MTAPLAPLEVMTSKEPIILDMFNVDDSGQGTGPRLGCVNCQEDVRSVASTDGALWRKRGETFHVLECPDCFSTLVEGFDL